MGWVVELRLVAVADADEDAVEAAVWAARLTAELEDLDHASLVEVTEQAPDGAKGDGATVGALLARLTHLDALKALVEAARSWATRTGRTVEVSVDGDVLKLTGASREQQDRIVEAWIVRHAPAD